MAEDRIVAFAADIERAAEVDAHPVALTGARVPASSLGLTGPAWSDRKLVLIAPA